jgi:hypothetical protein
MLLSNAVRLAQSKGLHLQTAKSPQLRDEDIALRNVIWWNLYMYDKHLTYRSGRPSVFPTKDPDLWGELANFLRPLMTMISPVQSRILYSQAINLTSGSFRTLSDTLRSPRSF